MTKQCTKCGEVKGVGEFTREKKGKYGIRSECRLCRTQYNTTNKKRKRQYDIDNKEHIKNRLKQYRLDNKEHIRQSRLDSKNRLSDSYINDLISKLTGLAYKDIPQELVEAKRLVIMAKRKGLISYRT